MPNHCRPPDFDEYWRQLGDELDATPLAAEEEHLPLHSGKYCDCYAVRFTGVGPYRLFGYLSVPRGEGPFPAILNGPGYRSAVEPLPQGDSNGKRARFVIFSSAARGQRNADEPFSAEFPGLMTKGIEAPETYIYRGIVADWLRAVDYLLTRRDVDCQRVAAVKHDSLPILAAALRPQITHIVSAPGRFLQFSDDTTDELQDYLRMYPDKQDLVEQTLSYFNPTFFASAVGARSLLWGTPLQLQFLAEAFAGKAEVRATAHSSYKDGLFEERWLAEHFGFSEPILPNCWQAS